MKIDMKRQILWYATFNNLSQKYPFESIEHIIAMTNDYVDRVIDSANK